MSAGETGRRVTTHEIVAKATVWVAKHDFEQHPMYTYAEAAEACSRVLNAHVSPDAIRGAMQANDIILAIKPEDVPTDNVKALAMGIVVLAKSLGAWSAPLFPTDLRNKINKVAGYPAE